MTQHIPLFAIASLGRRLSALSLIRCGKARKSKVRVQVLDLPMFDVELCVHCFRPLDLFLYFPSSFLPFFLLSFLPSFLPFFVSFHFRAAPAACGSSQARVQIGTTAVAGLQHSRSNSRLEPHLQPTTQLTAVQDL